MTDASLGEPFGRVPRPLQVAAARRLLAGGDGLLVLPTGGGKSLAWQMAAVVAWREGRGPTLVISPLLALMRDQVAALEALGLPAVHFGSDLDAAGRQRARERAGGCVAVFVSPESATGVLRRLARVAFLVVDEAHCVTEWGHQFRPEYARLGSLRDHLGVPTLAMTATATPAARADLATALHLRAPDVWVGSLRRPRLAYAVTPLLGDRARLQAAMDALRDAGFAGSTPPGRAIVYAVGRARVTSVARAIRAAGFDAAHTHAGRTTGARAKAEAAFVDGDRPVLVTTSAWGMGVDLPDVRLVLHVQAPPTLEAWVQQAGRAGRAGEPASARLWASPADRRVAEALWGPTPGPGLRAGHEALWDLVDGLSCRAVAIEAWLGGEPNEPCGVCDACVDPEGVRTRRDAARKGAKERRSSALAKRSDDAGVTLTEAERDVVVAFVGQLRRPVGRLALAGGLRGSRARALKRWGFEAIPEFGALQSRPVDAVVRAIDRLLGEGRLERKGRKYPTVWAAGRPVRPKSGTPKVRKVVEPGFATLRQWRTSAARRLRWKPYQVATDATLKALLAARPTDLAGLLEVPGMGPKRTERFGAALLDLLSRMP